MSQSLACVMLFRRQFDCCLYSLALLLWWVSTSPSRIGANSGMYLIWTWFHYIPATSALGSVAALQTEFNATVANRGKAEIPRHELETRWHERRLPPRPGVQAARQRLNRIAAPGQKWTFAALECPQT